MYRTSYARVAAFVATLLFLTACDSGRIVDPTDFIPRDTTSTPPVVQPPAPVQKDSIVYQNLVDKELWVVGVDGTNDHRLVGTGTGVKVWPSFSPSGDTLFFGGNGVCGPQTTMATLFDGSMAPWSVAKLDTSGKCVTLNSQISSVSPDGKYISFSAGSSFEIFFSAYEMGIDGSNVRRLESRTSPYAVMYSPDGRKIIYGVQVLNAMGDSVLWDELAELDRSSSVKRQLWKDPSSIHPVYHDISPSGEWVVARGILNKRVLVTRTNGSGEWRYLTPLGVETRAAWFCTGDEWVYYILTSKPNSVRKVNLSGQSDQEVFGLMHPMEMARCRRAN